MSATVPDRAVSTPSSTSAPARGHWQRFTVAERVARSSFYVVAVAALVWSLKQIEVIPEFLYDAPQQTVDLFQRMWPFDWKYYPKAVHAALVETLHIATLGTLLSLAIAVPLSVLAARNITRNRTLNSLAQFIFVATRSVNSLIWALLFVAVFGPGALAGVLSIACRSIGFVGKLFCEALEEAAPGPIEALTACGAPGSLVLAKGYWPQVQPSFWSLALLRWDINIRESAVLGLVGAGGIGVALDSAMNNLYWDQVGLILGVIFLVVMVTEVVTTAIRSRIL
jgi:phosphonate transport system permease protein